MISKGIRGAITVEENSQEAIGAATIKLLTEMVKKNNSLVYVVYIKMLT